MGSDSISETEGSTSALALTPLVTAISIKIKSGDSFVAGRPLQDFGMAQRPSGIAISGFPMFLHTEPRKLIILGMALIGLWAINQMNDGAVSRAAEELCFATALEVFRKVFQQAGKGVSHFLYVLELIGACTRAARVANFFFSCHHFEHVAWKLAARALHKST